MKKTFFIIIIILALTILTAIMVFNIKEINKTVKKEEIPELSYMIYANQDDNYKTLVKFYKEEGIKKVINPEGLEIYCNGKNQMSMDYEMKLGQEYSFKIETENGIEEKKITITEEYLKKHVIDIQAEGEKNTLIKAEIPIMCQEQHNRKYYKIGENETKWIEYKDSIKLDSYEIIEKNLQNDDNTITIYAKGVDKAGNEIATKEKINILDVDIAKKPEITQITNEQYATVTADGIALNNTATIKYEDRDDIENYYKLNNGEWQLVEENTTTININRAKLSVKSVKKSSGLTIENTSIINPLAEDALQSIAYDEDTTTSIYGIPTQNLMKIDENAIGETLQLSCSKPNWQATLNIKVNFLNSSKEIIKQDILSLPGVSSESVVKSIIPENAKYVQYIGERWTNWTGTYYSRLYEISVKSYPLKYPIITDTGVKNTIINGEYAFVNYHSNLEDALGYGAYDGNKNSYANDKPYVTGNPIYDGPTVSRYLEIDNSTVGKTANIMWGDISSYVDITMKVLNADKSQTIYSKIQGNNVISTDSITITEDMKWIEFEIS